MTVSVNDNTGRHNLSWRRLQPLIRLGVPLVLLGLLWNLADGPGAMQRLEQVDWPLLVAAFLCVNLQTLASAQRWRWVARRLGLHIPRRQAIAEYYLAQLVNQSVPGGIVGDAARAIRLRHQAGLARAAQAVVIERMAGQIMMLGVLVLGLATALLWPGGLPVDAVGPYAFGVLAGVIVLGAALWLIRRKRLWRWTRQWGAAVVSALISRGAWLEQGLIGLMIVALNLASFTLCAEATGTRLGPEAVLVLVPLILCAMLVPATIAGWGFREGAAATLFPLTGASAAAGLAASIAFGLVILVASLPGLLFLRGVKQPARSPSP